jgi:hypothetical protein
LSADLSGVALAKSEALAKAETKPNKPNLVRHSCGGFILQITVSPVKTMSYACPPLRVAETMKIKNKPNQTQYLAPNFMLGVLFYGLECTIGHYG